MLSPVFVWSSVAGLAVFGVGLIVRRRELAEARGMDKLVALGPVLYCAPLAAFGGEHLTAAQAIMQGVPKWIPGALFWTYLVGFALIAAGLSIAAKRMVRWSGTLTGIMIFLFVVLLHAPEVVATPGSRVRWAVLFRDLAFAAAGWALAGGDAEGWSVRTRRWMVLGGRISIGLATVLFGVQYLVFPLVAWGIPLEKMTPAWVPAPAMWGYLNGVILLAGGLAILANLRARTAAIGIGVVMVAATLALYVPILAMEWGTDLQVEGMNYVADTLMYGGALWVLTKAMTRVGEAKAASRIALIAS